jgi:hypothetical protein
LQPLNAVFRPPSNASNINGDGKGDIDAAPAISAARRRWNWLHKVSSVLSLFRSFFYQLFHAFFCFCQRTRTHQTLTLYFLPSLLFQGAGYVAMILAAVNIRIGVQFFR